VPVWLTTTLGFLVALVIGFGVATAIGMPATILLGVAVLVGYQLLKPRGKG
jgi:hypothetical protein